MIKNPIGFLSYVRSDDEHDDGRLTEFRRRLSGEVVAQTGERFDIFQDRTHIAWGQSWEERIHDCVDAGIFLICIITPGFFKSEMCRSEIERFALREKLLGRRDLILPVYYIHCPVLSDESLCRNDPVAQLISERNYVDWRALRFDSLKSPRSKKMFAKLAGDIRSALETRFPAEGFGPVAGTILPS